MKKWVALFSQTGSEIVDLALHFDRWPDIIITNNKKDNIHPIIKPRITHTVSEPQAETLNILDDAATCYDLVTLHGWLKIVPESKCNKFDIYNGHPGLITEYPELKGKDPQQRFFNNLDNYNYYGSVVHKVVPEVDSGKIVSECKRFNIIKSLDHAFDNLRATSRTAWIDFLQTDSIISV
tara:strand:+ start:664 stop:1203 length:540 start_codon:yes stop_codon:yes gene_type:complete